MADASQPPKVILDLAPSIQNQSGFRLVDVGELYALWRAEYGIQSGIAATGTTKGTARQLTAANSVIATASAGNVGAIMPPGLPGQTVTVVNMGSVAITLYGSGGDQIIPIASGTPAATISQASNTTSYYLCISKTFNPSVSTWKQVSVN